jgi:predicted short-subunit dehydrogenase-like oxidoreductase (DUF2520 family)
MQSATAGRHYERYWIFSTPLLCSMSALKVTVSVIGSGNVAWHLASRLFTCGYTIPTVFSPTIAHARLLAEQIGATAVDDLSQIHPADMFLLAVKDDAYHELIPQLPKTDSLYVHTAGSLPMTILQACSPNYGVLYPFQSLRKTSPLDFATVPLCIEASNAHTKTILMQIAQTLSPICHLLDGEQRAYLHLAGVFVGNFTNALYAIGQALLEQQGLDFQLLLPLIHETLAKLTVLSPTEAQTGPAVRKDTLILNRHLDMLSHPQWKELYQLMSNLIQQQSILADDKL